MTGVFCLRYDLAVSIFPTTSLGRWQSNLRHNSLDLRSSSLGSPPKARFFSRLPGLRHGAGGSALLAVYAWRTLCAVRQGLLHGGPARRSITFCQSCQGSAQKFGGFLSQNEPPQRTKKGVRTVGSAAFWFLCRRGQRNSRPEARNSPGQTNRIDKEFQGYICSPLVNFLIPLVFALKILYNRAILKLQEVKPCF